MDDSHKQYSVYAGESVTLICGTGIVGNPEPIVTWTHPQASIVIDSGKGRYIISEGPSATLTINGVTESDRGIWMCTVEINSKDLSVACPDPNTSSRTRYVEIEVVVIGKLLI